MSTIRANQIGNLEDSYVSQVKELVATPESYIPLGAYSGSLIINSYKETFTREGITYRAKSDTILPLDLTGVWNTDSAFVTTLGDNTLRNEVQGFLDGGWYTPTLVLDGVTDQTSVIQDALTRYKRVRLPEGTIKADVLIPSNCSLFGAGRKLWNGSTWTGSGTQINGRIKVNGNTGCAAGMMSVDGVSSGTNAIEAVGSGTRFHYFSQINTRANDHGWLFEQKGADPLGAFTGGDILVEDAIHTGGPNGFAVKMRNVTYVRCYAFEVTVQAFVAVSDNITGASIYSRAVNVSFIDCGGGSNYTMLRVYSRDEFSLTNTNGVQPASDIRWIRGSLSGCTSHGAYVGDDFSGSPTFSYINPEDVVIDGAAVTLNGGRGLLVTRGTRVTMRNCRVGDNGGNQNVDFDTFGDRAIELDYLRNSYFNVLSGFETGVRDVDTSTSVIDARKGFNLFRTTSGSLHFFSSVLGGKPGQRFSILIRDDLTVVNIDPENVVHGKNTLVEFMFDPKSGVWKVFSIIGNNEEGGSFAAGTLTMDFSRYMTTSMFTSVDNNVTSMAVTTPPVSAVGKPFTMRIRNTNVGTINLTWPAAFKFVDALTAPATLATGKTLIVRMMWDGVNLVVFNSNTYT